MNTDLHSSLMLFGCTGIAIGLFVLAMPRHHVIALGAPSSPLRSGTLRLAAWFTLLVSLVIALARWNDGITLILWFALLAFHSFAATLIVTYAARYWRVSMLAAAVTLAVGLTGPTGLTTLTDLSAPSGVAGSHTPGQNASSR